MWPDAGRWPKPDRAWAQHGADSGGAWSLWGTPSQPYRQPALPPPPSLTRDALCPGYANCAAELLPLPHKNASAEDSGSGSGPVRLSLSQMLEGRAASPTSAWNGSTFDVGGTPPPPRIDCRHLGLS